MISQMMARSWNRVVWIFPISFLLAAELVFVFSAVSDVAEWIVTAVLDIGGTFLRFILFAGKTTGGVGEVDDVVAVVHLGVYDVFGAAEEVLGFGVGAPHDAVKELFVGAHT